MTKRRGPDAWRWLQVTEQEERELDDLLRNIRPKMLELERLSKRVRDGSFSGREERALTFLEAVRDKLDLSEDLRRRLVVRDRGTCRTLKLLRRFVGHRLTVAGPFASCRQANGQRGVCRLTRTGRRPRPISRRWC